MCRPSRWRLGLAPLAALFLVALFWKGPKVEADVAAHARAALAKAGVADAVIVVEGRDVRVSGLASGDPASARAAALAAPGVRKIFEDLKPAPQAQAEAPQAEAPQAQAPQAQASQPAATAPTPQALALVFEARKLVDGAIRLSGAVPSEASRALVEKTASARGAVAGAPAVVSGFSSALNFDRLAELGFVMLDRMKSGWLRVGDDGLSLGGEAAPQDADAIRAALRRSGVKIGAIEIGAAATAPLASPPPPPPIAAPVAATPPPVVVSAPRPVDPAALACHGRILERLADETVEFATGSAEIAAKSEALIARLAEVIKGCPEADLEVAGHTDDVGDPQRNLALSRERAEAVVKALAAAGAPAGRLTAIGYGDARPVVANDSAEGRARNRRIEFVLK